VTILRNVISERDESGWRQLFRWYYWYKAFRQLYCLKFQLHTKSFISFWRYNESKVCCRCLPTPECPPIGPHSIEGLLTNYKNALDSAAREVLGPRLYAKKPGIYLRRLSIIDQRKNEANLSNAERWPIPHHFECAVITWRHPCTVVRELGIYLDSDDSMRSQVSQTGSHCFYILCQLRSIRRSVSCTVFQSVTLAGIPAFQLDRL